MTLDEIFELWSKDSDINKLAIDEETLKSPKLHNKYYKLLCQERLILKKNETDYKRLFLEKYEYFMGTLDEETLKERKWSPNPRAILKSDIPMHIEADSDIINLTLKIGYQKEKISALESIVKSILERNWIVKNYIDWQKFTNGVM